MHFDLIQSLSLAGDAAVPNDDRAGAGDRRAWIIDGATDLGPPGLVGARGGAAWLAMAADRALAEAPDAPIADLCEAVFAALAECWETARTREPISWWELPLAAFLAVRLDEGGLECAWLGDCAALLMRGDAVRRLGPAPALRDAESAAAARLAPHGLGRKFEGAILDALRVARDTPERRALTVGRTPHAAPEILKTACAGGDELLIMTDGFAALIDQYDLFTARQLGRALRSEGLASLADLLRAAESNDPDCVTYPRFKRSDDATALWLRIAG